EKLLSEVRENFGSQCRPLFLPLGLGQDCRGVVSLLEAEEAPEGVVGDFESAREAALESVIECDDALMERYLEGEQISRQEITGTLGRAVAGGGLVPVLCCAAQRDVGVKETLEFLAACAPSPAEGPARSATDRSDEEVALQADPDGPFCARVFQVSTDVHLGKIASFRVYSGSLGGDLSVQLARTRKPERLGHIYVISGQEHHDADGAVPGDILCVTKVEELRLDDTLCGQDGVLTLKPTAYPTPMMSLAVRTQSRDDEQKVNAGLHSLAEGDATFTIHRDQQSGEMVITGMSSLHLDVMLGKLKQRYDVSVETYEPSTPYHETITRSASGQYRHKKQTGGRGQYGVVILSVAPGETASGETVRFVNEIKQ
ncbi:MAG: elongation factor G, partial [Candidatus Brocadiae bacterium]|nr:elongation factor G [Candidatus Brocadiia bacterium]